MTINKWKCFSRVSITPAVTQALVKKGFTVNIEENAGVDAKFRNSDYESAGAKLVNTQKAFQSGKKYSKWSFEFLIFLIISRYYLKSSTTTTRRG